jgi:lipid A disaccharide synthetase
VIERYIRNGAVKPPTFHYDKMHIHQKKEYEWYLDHFFYTLPIPAVNWEQYTFPSTYIGSNTVNSFYRFLYSRSAKFKDLVKENTIFISKEFNSRLIEGLVNEERSRFRDSFKIPDTNTVIYVHLGITKEEVKKNVTLVKKAIGLFFDKFKNEPGQQPKRAVSKETFTVVYTAAHELGNFPEQQVKSANFSTPTQFVHEENDRFSAIAGADIGIAPNGEAVSECAAGQLPTMILDDIPGWKAYYTLLYNSFNNDLNISVSGEAYPELTHGQINPLKVSIILQ